jgi:hypothetical protein
VFGASSTNLKDLAPGATAEVSLTLTNNPLNQASLSDRVVGQIEWDFNGAISNEAEQRKLVRRSILDQLTYDPMTGFQSSFASDSPVLLAWGDDPVVPMEIEGVRVRRVANILYQVPVALTVGGEVTFRSDLLRTSVVEVNANFFSKDPWTISFGTGNVRLAFRPLPFDGTFTPKQVVVAMTFGGDIAIPSGNPKALVEKARCDPADEDCVAAQDGLPDIEVLDIRTGEWVQFAHMQQGTAYELVDVGRWVDPASGEVQVRFVNERQEGIGFQFPISISGVIR